MATSDKEWKQLFWKAAKRRLQDLGFDSEQRGTLRGLLLPKTREECEEYFDGDDEEVKAMLRVLLRQGACVWEGRRRLR